MKKNVLKKVAITTAVITAATAVTVFATESKKNNLTGTENSSEAEENEVSNEADDQAATPKYVTQTGVITEVGSEKDGYTRVRIGEGTDGIVLNIAEDVFVIDSSDNSYKKVSDLKEDMEITVIISANSPMTLSLPPMTSGAAGVVIGSEGSFASVGMFNDELVALDNSLKLNISEDTTIVDITGAKKVFTEEDVKNTESLVIYGPTTRSIPPQTNPYFVMILAEIEEGHEDLERKEQPNNTPEATENTEEPSESKVIAPLPDPIPEAKAVAKLVPLRDTVVESGYSVKWVSNDEPVVFEKDGVTFSVTVGTKTFVKNGESKELSTETVLNDSKIYVSSEITDEL